MPPRFRYLSFALCASTLLLSPLGHAQQTAAANTPSSTPRAPTGAASSAPASPTETANKMIADGVKRMYVNDADGALNDFSQAIKLNPNNEDVYLFRAAIYCQKKQWALAENDFRTAGRIAPTNPLPKLNLVEIKFMQKQYDLARPGFVAMESDPDMGDFASYKVFLCDLFGGHEDTAKKELDAFNDAAENPSYYFSNAAWDLVHKNIDDARGWLVSASNIYPPGKNNYYAQSLRDLGYLPIPAPGNKVTPPPASGNP